MSYDNSNTGVLFKNDKKTPGDKLPDYRGNCEVNGVKMDVAGWIKDSTKKPGMKFLSLKFSEPWTKAAKEAIKMPPSPQHQTSSGTSEDDVPF
jgi:hypothetical protein